jgi:AGZA family xanthine/uracil permease-like MFS transporter
MVFVLGLLLTAVLYAKRVRAAFLLGIAGTTLLAIVVNQVGYGGEAVSAISPSSARLPAHIVALPDAASFALIGAFDLGFVSKMGLLGAALAVVTLMLSDFFDTMGTVVGLAERGGFVDDRHPDARELPRLRRVLLIDGIAAAVGGAFGCSSNTTYIESAAGIGAGGRTGLTSVVVGVLFLASIVLWPLADVVPPQATAPALVLTGALMIGVVRDIEWSDPGVAVPAFLTLTVMPFTYSITNGIGAGIIAHVVIALGRGEGRTLHPLLVGCAVFFAAYFAR